MITSKTDSRLHIRETPTWPSFCDLEWTFERSFKVGYKKKKKKKKKKEKHSFPFTRNKTRQHTGEQHRTYISTLHDSFTTFLPMGACQRPRNRHVLPTDALDWGKGFWAEGVDTGRFSALGRTQVGGVYPVIITKETTTAGSLIFVDEAHCCDTSWSLQLLVGRHSKVTSSKQGCKPSLVK